jgi:type IV secretion system protein VirB10
LRELEASKNKAVAKAPVVTDVSPFDRKMAGSVLFELPSSKGGAADGSTFDQVKRQGPDRPSGTLGSGNDALTSRLQASVFDARSAARFPDMDYLLKRGTTVPCALKTGIDTTLPGIVICTALNDVYSASGKTLLIERGASVFGEQQSSLKQGQARTFVIWTRIDNPNGVFANIDSPASDVMGYSGIPGEVDTHFWARFGGAIMISLIKDFSQSAAIKSSGVAPSQGPYANTATAADTAEASMPMALSCASTTSSSAGAARSAEASSPPPA